MELWAKKPTKREYTHALIGGALAMLAVLAISSRYSIYIDFQHTRCLPWMVYLSTPISKDIQKGDYIVFEAKNNVFLGKRNGEIVGKQVVGVPGDRVLISNDGVFINDTKIGHIEDYAAYKLNRPARSFDASYTVPTNNYFVAGTEPHSFDSRYWGVLDNSLIRGKIVGLF